MITRRLMAPRTAPAWAWRPCTGKLWSSRTQTRGAGTAPPPRSPAARLFISARADPRWAGPDTRASILDGPDVADLHIRLFAETQTDRRAGGTITWYGEEMTEEAFAGRMVAEQRLIYEFSLQKACGYDT